MKQAKAKIIQLLETDIHAFVKEMMNEENYESLSDKRPFQAYVDVLFESPKRNIYFDAIGIDWIYKSFPYPELMFQGGLLISAIEKQINNPIDAIKQYFILTRFKDDLPCKLFYKKVICNPYVNITQIFNGILEVLKVADNIEKALTNIEEVMFRYYYDKNYTDIINKYRSLNKFADVFQTNDTLEKQLLQVEIIYDGEIILPENCKIIKSKGDIENLGVRMKHCIRRYSKALLSKQIFIIQMELPEPVTFLIGTFQHTDWFCIGDAKGVKNEVPKLKSMEIMSKYIIHEKNQEFFRNNYIEESKCLEDLLNEI